MENHKVEMQNMFSLSETKPKLRKKLVINEGFWKINAIRP